MKAAVVRNVDVRGAAVEGEGLAEVADGGALLCEAIEAAGVALARAVEDGL